MSPAARTLQALRQAGYTADVVERWLPQASKRRDYLGCIDLIACRPGEPILAIQATTASHVAARITKARSLPGLHVWLATGHALFEVWGWQKRDGRWHVRRVALLASDLHPVDLTPRPRRARRAEQRSLFE